MPESPATPAHTGNASDVARLATVVRVALRERYTAPIVRLVGEQVEVLAGKALDLARDAARVAGVADVEQRVIAIDHATLAWWSVPPQGLRLWRQHGLGDDAPGGELVTELAHRDPPLQVVGELDGWQLVRCADGANGWICGWVDEHGHPTLQPCLAPLDAHPADLAFDADAFAHEVASFLDVPYVWGGTSRAGVDCSGLVQRCAWTVGRRWLPRHSTALLRAGERVAIAKIARGDVLVLRRDVATIPAETLARRAADGETLHPMHVAVAVDADTVVHASRDEWKVVREPLADIRARYRVLGVRRLAGGAGS